MDVHGPGLSDAEGPVGGLVLHRGVPPAIEVDDVVRAREVHADATGLEREDEDGRRFAVLESFDHLIPTSLRRATVQEERFHVELLAEDRGEQMAHLSELREDQRLVLRGHDLFQDLDEPDALAGSLAEAFALLRREIRLPKEVGRMVADLLQSHESGEDQSAATDSRRFVDLAKHVLDDGVVELGLLGGELDVLAVLDQRREIVGHAVVGLEASKHEGTDEMP